MSETEHSTIWTIGYGNRSIEDLLALIERERIAYLIDVRSAPYSRFKPEFSKDALKAALDRARVRYVFMGNLLGGRPDDASLYVDGKVDYARVAESDAFKRGIGRVLDALSQRLHVCLMCSEGRPEECHRTKLIGVELARMAVDVRHIDSDGSVVTQDLAMQRVTGGQQDLFGTHQTSRKRYHRHGGGD